VAVERKEIVAGRLRRYCRLAAPGGELLAGCRRERGSELVDTYLAAAVALLTGALLIELGLAAPARPPRRLGDPDPTHADRDTRGQPARRGARRLRPGRP